MFYFFSYACYFALAFFQLIFDRRIGDYKLPDGWIIVSAGNMMEDRVSIFEMDSSNSSSLKSETITSIKKAGVKRWWRYHGKIFNSHSWRCDYFGIGVFGQSKRHADVGRGKEDWNAGGWVY